MLLLLLLLVLLALLVLLVLLLLFLLLVLSATVLLLVFQQLLAEGEVIARLIVFRVVAQRLLIELNGAGIFLGRLPHDTGVVVYLCQLATVCLRLCRNLIFAHGLLRLVLEEHGVPEVIVCGSGLRIGFESLAVADLRIDVGTVAVLLVATAQVVAFRLLRTGSRTSHKQQHRHRCSPSCEQMHIA